MVVMRSCTAARRSIDRIGDAGCVSMRKKAAAPDGVSLDTFRGTATARLELGRSKVGRADVISPRDGGAVTKQRRSVVSI
jgi:hypothetical protein